jgi:hypothetical protein
MLFDTENTELAKLARIDIYQGDTPMVSNPLDRINCLIGKNLMFCLKCIFTEHVAHRVSHS